MKSIKAIVLSYDKYRSFADHMIFCYENLWPNHPFIFQVPYQTLAPTLQTNKVQYHQCPSDIKSTVLTLLDGLDDDEMIYWCIDDKYPINLNIRKIEKIHNWLFSEKKEDISGLLFCRCRDVLKKKNLTGNKLAGYQGGIFLERKNYHQIWIHQYVKVKVLRHLFNSFPDDIPVAGMMDKFKNQMEKPSSHSLYVTKNSLAIFGESTDSGIMTMNCFKSFEKNNFKIPSWASQVTSYEITMGNEDKSNFSEIDDAKGIFSKIINKVKGLF